MASSETDRLLGFPAEIFRMRRTRVLEALGDGAMLLPAAPPLYRSGDSEIRYRPDSDLFYLTGFAEPGGTLVLRGFADEARAVLFVRPRDERAERWSGPRAGPEGARTLLGFEGVEEVRSMDELPAALPGLLSGADRVHFRLGGARSGDGAFERAVVDALAEARRTGARRGTGPRGVLEPGEILHELRLRKDPHEVAALRQAAEVTVAGFRAGLARIAPGVGEWEVEAELEAAFRGRGAAAPAFSTIVASGMNACVLHHVQNTRRMEAGELVLVDAGAEYRMYSGDVTRTVPVSGSFTPEQRAVYEVVEEARRTAVGAVRPGATVAEVHEQAVGVLTTGLRSLGVLAGTTDQLLESKAYEPYFPHRTSHWLGMDTHDPGDYVRDGRSRRLEPGMVLTVEPGLYFPDGVGEAVGGDERFLGLGVRIEDDVLVSESGGEVLTGALPTEVAEVEAWMQAHTGKGEGA